MLLGEEGGDALAGEPADFESAGRHRFGSIRVDAAIQFQNAKAGAKALFGMRAAGENRGDQPFGARPDLGGPPAEPVRRPLGVTPVRTRHVIGIRAVPAAQIATLMDADALTAVENLDHAGGDAHIDLGADQRVRNRIEKVVDLDVIVEIDARAFPFGELPIGRRQRIEGGALDLLEQFAPSTSFRSATYLATGCNAITVKVHRPRAIDRSHGLVERLKRDAMHALFGVPASFDGGALYELDILHSLDNSQRVSMRLESWGGDRYGVMREIAGLAGEHGTGCIMRETEAWPRRAEPSIVVPFFAFLEPPRSGHDNLLRELGGGDIGHEARIAMRLSAGALGLWRHLAFACDAIAMMPHGQNLMCEILPGGAIGRIIVKDFRDVEHLPRYFSTTHRSVFLSGIDQSYLRYEMAVHPFYYDVSWRIEPRYRLAASLFNYSYQMLRSYVLRPLATQVAYASRAAGNAVLGAQAAILSAMADGVDDGVIETLIEGLPLALDRRVSTLLPARAFRRRWLAWIDGS